MSKIPVLSGSAMREADRFTIQETGIPGRVLMESAGRSAAQFVEDVNQSGPITVLCGTGNNGGDGFVIARWLAESGRRVNVVLAGPPKTKDASDNLDSLRHLSANRPGIEIFDIEDGLPERPSLIVDAVLGTGTKSDVREPARSLIEWANGQDTVVVSIDVPSGLDSDTGHPLGIAVRATHTLALGAIKVGHLINEGPALVGKMTTLSIGIPAHVLSNHSSAWIASSPYVAKRLTPRDRQAHKYSAGTVLTITGSPGLTGATQLACTAASRAGCGAVICAASGSIQQTLAETLTEAIRIPLPETEGGLDPTGVDALEASLEKASVVLIGCGLGRAESTRQFVQRFVSTVNKPMIIDADGLMALSPLRRSDILSEDVILTPHWGEFKHLTGPSDLHLEERHLLCQEMATRWQATLVMKGFPAFASDPSGELWINQTGNPGLATAGTGDVLAGMIAGFRSRGLSSIDATVSALHVGGLVAEDFSQTGANEGLVAGDMPPRIPPIVKQLSTP